MPKILTVAYTSVAAAAVALLVVGHPRAPVVLYPVTPAASPAATVPAAAAPAPAMSASRPPPAAPARAVAPPWVTPDVDKLADDSWGRTVRYGRDLITKTYALIGPEVADKSRALRRQQFVLPELPSGWGHQAVRPTVPGVLCGFSQLPLALGGGRDDRGPYPGLYDPEHEQ